ncbi:MAG TPA: hypothetical protein VFA04_09095 [Bryobacteraceae bacterium]|nr:hypothetical protein [Bryobacteraceae bacterium]
MLFASTNPRAGGFARQDADTNPKRPLTKRGTQTLPHNLCSKLASLLLLAGSAHAATYYVTVAGLGGEPDYEQRFEGWAKDIERTLKGSADASTVTTLYGPTATRDAVRTTLRQIAGRAHPDDAFVLMLIGHGTFDGEDYKINLPGPDMTGIEFAELLDRIPAKRQLVVNMTSASGASMEALRRQGRAVITATKSGYEKNATVFARYWVAALTDPAADTNKDGTISALEAFKYAEQKTGSFYDTQKRLATEHPLLEDTGAGQATRAPGRDNGEGLVASAFPVLRIDKSQAVANSPEKRALLAKKDELESLIDQLKYKKASIPADEYKTQVTDLLLQLARTQAEIDK